MIVGIIIIIIQVAQTLCVSRSDKLIPKLIKTDVFFDPVRVLIRTQEAWWRWTSWWASWLRRLVVDSLEADLGMKIEAGVGIFFLHLRRASTRENRLIR